MHPCPPLWLRPCELFYIIALIHVCCLLRASLLQCHMFLPNYGVLDVVLMLNFVAKCCAYMQLLTCQRMIMFVFSTYKLHLIQYRSSGN